MTRCHLMTRICERCGKHHQLAVPMLPCGRIAERNLDTLRCYECQKAVLPPAVWAVLVPKYRVWWNLAQLWQGTLPPVLAG